MKLNNIPGNRLGINEKKRKMEALVSNHLSEQGLKIISSYTGIKKLDEAVSDRKSRSLLWLEILFNEDISWERIRHPAVKKSYEKACLWYWAFKSLINSCVKRKPLALKKGRPDPRDYRKFLEALNFVSA